MTRFIIGDLLTGRRINNLNVVTGSWSQVLNDSGDISCTVSLRDPATRRLGLAASATPGKAFLAAVQDNNILQAGPIWVHDYDRDTQMLTLTGSGMWSYFDHRVLIPILAGRLPTDVTTDTNFASSSLHDIASFLVSQARSWTNGNVPVTLPSGIAGTAIRNYKGSDLGMVGSRLRELTQVLGGPDIIFQPTFTTDMLGVTWAMQIGSPTQPLLFGAQDVYFKPSAPKKGSISALKVHSDGTGIASQTFATGGATVGSALMAISTSSVLTSAGYALTEATDTTHTDAVELATVQGYSDELLLLGKSPLQSWSFTHDTTVAAPLLGSFRQGDFAQLTIHGDPYIQDGMSRHRMTSISGDEIGKRVNIVTQPQVQ